MTATKTFIECTPLREADYRLIDHVLPDGGRVGFCPDGAWRDRDGREVPAAEPARLLVGFYEQSLTSATRIG